MFQFDKISVNQILAFCEVINESSLFEKEFIQSKYLRRASNFAEVCEFLEKLHLIENRERQILLKPKYKQFLKDLKQAQKAEEITKSFIVNSFINQKTYFSEYLNEFLSYFHLINEQYEFTPSVSERLKYSGLRNFLIDLEFLYIDPSEVKYVIRKDYTVLCGELKESYRLSLDEFLRIQQKREEIGRAAELQILEYEKQRLSQFPHLAEKIEHIAVTDVAAGYDIKSFDGKLRDDGNPIQRYIEVKAVSPWDYGFKWTINEIEKSKFYDGDYYLYLLPVVVKNKFDLNNLKIINDPYANVYKNTNEWIRTEEVVAFSLSKD